MALISLKKAISLDSNCDVALGSCANCLFKLKRLLLMLVFLKKLILTNILLLT